MQYYLAYNGKRINIPLPRDDAIKLLMETKGAIKGLSILIYDDRGKFVKEIGRNKRL